MAVPWQAVEMRPHRDVAADRRVVRHTSGMSLVADHVPYHLVKMYKLPVGHLKLVGDHVFGHIGAL